MKLTIRKSDASDDWYVIERAEHDGRQWLERTEYGAALRCSSRFSDADIEGTAAEMLEIANAIEARRNYGAKRCSVDVRLDETVAFFSPRNSTKDGIVSLADADDLAIQIRAELGEPAAPRPALEHKVVPK